MHAVPSFAGCDYLGLRDHPKVVSAAHAALDLYGVGTTASRATTGTTPLHSRLETEIAEFVGVEAALVLPSGALASLLIGESFLPRNRSVYLDPRSHPSLRTAHDLAGAPRVEDARSAAVILTDGVFPSLGEIAPLGDHLAALPDDGILVVDDCHGLGVVGPGGRGSLAAHGIDDPRVVTISTASKALGGAGGFLLGSRQTIDILRQGDLHVGSTAIPAHLCAAASAALAVLRDQPERHAALLEVIDIARTILPQVGVAVGRDPLPVFRIDGPDSTSLARLSLALGDAGCIVPHIHYPGAPPVGYLRGAVSARHSRADLERLAETLGKIDRESLQ